MPAQKPTKILFADDSMTMRKVAEITFADEAFQLELLSGGGEVVNAIKMHSPDVVVLDSDMPGMNGYELCKKIREESRWAGLPVILLTGPSSPYDEQRSREAGVTAHIDKPFETQAMLDKVTTLAAEAAARPVAPPSEEKVAAKVPPASVAVARTKLGGKTQIGIASHLKPDEPRPIGAPKQGPAAAAARTAPKPAPTAPTPRPLAQAAPAPAPQPAVAPPAAAPAAPSQPARTPQAAPQATAPHAPPGPSAPAQAPSARVAALAQIAQRATDKTLAQKAADLSPEQIEAVREVARDVIEHVVWDVVPNLAETIIREELAKLLAE